MTYPHDPQYEDLDGHFDAAEAPDTSFREVPTGTYQVYVERAVFDQPEWSDWPRLSLTCKIISGEYEGSAVFPGSDTNPEYIKYLKATLIKMGFDPPPSPSQLPYATKDMLDRVLEVYVAPKKEGSKYANCYVNRFIRMLDEKPSGSNSPPPHTDADDPTGGW